MTVRHPHIPPQRLTAETIADVAKLLREDVTMTVVGACLKAGYPKAANAIRQALWRIRQGQASDEQVELLSPLLAAVEGQCQGLVKRGLDLVAKGNRTGFIEYLLEAKMPLEYGRRQKVEVTGKDGDDLVKEIDAELVKKTVKDLLEVAITADKVAKDGGG